MTRIRRDTNTVMRLRQALYPAPLALAIALSVNVAHGATIVVDSADAASEAGKCTIIDAVTAINTATAVNNCIAGDGNNDTIDLNGFTSPTTITFDTVGAKQSHALVLNNAATINAPLDPTGAPLVTLTRSTVSNTPAFGIIHTTAPLTINGLKITNGNSGIYLGGAILSGGALTITTSVISGNSSDSAGGGIAATGKLTVQHSIISGNTAGNAGGGLYGGTGIEIDYSTLSGNSTSGAASSVNGGGGVFSSGLARLMRADILDNTSASAGGGVYAASGMNVSDSTISGNVASNGSGGGLSSNPAVTGTNLILEGSTIESNTAQGNGGGVLGGAVGIENCTLTGNLASGTGGAVQADMLMTNYTTIAQNQSTGPGGGANFTSSGDVDGTILFNNTAGGNADDIEGGAAPSGQHDIIGATTQTVPTGTLNCDPQLAALADNGGPTQTMALGAGSCAIDAAGTAASTPTDQRGYTRPAGSGTVPSADIGAYEAGAKDPDVIFSDGFGG
jgi:predicted outer membrane repeat protein